MNPKTKEFRQHIADEFIKCLEEDPLGWKKTWQGKSNTPINAVTRRRYRGLNHFWLTHIAEEQGYKDPRWCTFKQASDNQWKIKKGEKSVSVEYWMMYDTQDKKIISWSTFASAKKSADFDDKRYELRARYYNVFNAAQIEGIPPLPEPVIHDIQPSELIERISSEMGVPIINDGGDRAFYRVAEDTIHLPLPAYFETDYDYQATALHELSHATGPRLGRNMSGHRGSKAYAYEELVAEISSCFMAAELPVESTKAHMDNHKAYVQSWAAEIKDSPEFLIKAIKDAEKAAALLEFHAALTEEKDYEKTLGSSMEIPAAALQEQRPTLEEYREQVQAVYAYEIEHQIPEPARLTKWYEEMQISVAKPFCSGGPVSEALITARYNEILQKNALPPQQIKNLSQPKVL